MFSPVGFLAAIKKANLDLDTVSKEQRENYVISGATSIKRPVQICVF